MGRSHSVAGLQAARSASSRRFLLAAAGTAFALAASLSGCGDDDDAATMTTAEPQTTVTAAPSSTAAAVRGSPTPEELAEVLLTAGDLGDEWSASGGFESGVVTDAIRMELPQLEMCPEAGDEAAAAAAAFEWVAFAVFERPGETEEWPVVLGQFLATGEPGRIEEDFGNLRSGIVLCSEVDQPSAEGVTEVGEIIEIPDVGAESFGAQVLSSDGELRSSLRAAFVRSGPVFMFLDLLEVATGDLPVTVDEWNAIITTAARQLP